MIPLIASGMFGFPKDKVLKIAVDEISAFLLEIEMLVYIVVFDKTSYSISEKLFSDVTSFIEDTISHGNYNIFEINEALFAFDQSLLGA